MTLVFADRVKESTTSTGTGPLTLGGAESGFRAFSSVCVDGDTAYYCVTDGTSWEVGLGTFAAGVLSRTTVLSSSNGGALVALNPGPKDVFLTVPASVLQAAATIVSVDGITPPGVTGQLWFDVSGGGPAVASVYYGGWSEFAAGADPTTLAALSTIDGHLTTLGGQITGLNTSLGLLYNTLAPVFGTGNPTATSQPTDGTVVNYYDTSASPYVHYVFDGAAFHQVA